MVAHPPSRFRQHQGAYAPGLKPTKKGGVSYYSRNPLPPQMARKFSVPMDPTVEAICRRIAYHVETLQASTHMPPYNPPSNVQARNRTQYREVNPLKSLRLVSKAFARAATPAVFKSVAFFPSRNSQRVDMQTLMDILNSDIAPHVQTLIIRPQLSSSVDEQWLQCTQFALALPICFEKFHNLRAITVDGSVFLGLDRETEYSYTAPLLTSLRRSFVKALHDAFVSAPTRKVTGLVLDFPILEGLLQTYSAPYLPIPCSRAFSNLEHLSITVRYHSEHSRFTATTALPMQHQNYPAVHYETRFWNAVNSATNLRSLRIHCSTALDLGNIDLANLQRLEALDVARMRCRADHLLAICSPSRSSITSLRLYEVRLADGIWADVFLRLKQISTLIEFEAMALTYDMPSSHFARILQPLDPYLEMPRRDDRDAFQELTKAVLQRQAALANPAASDGHWAGYLNTLPN